jgi:hypothetical protein
MSADTVLWLCGHQCVHSPSGNQALILVGDVLLLYQWIDRPLYNITFSSHSNDRLSLLRCRTLCMEVPTFSTGAHALPQSSPTRVDPKPKCRRHLQNVFLDNRGFPDQSNDYDHVLHGVDGGPILWKLRHPQPDLDAPVDPFYYSPFIAKKHEDLMRKDMDLSHLDPTLQEKIYTIIHENWSVFDRKGVFVLVKNYECIIDTRSAQPIAVKKILHGKRETVIMQKCIAALAKVGHIRQITDGNWLFKALLMPKPHQEHVKNIDDFVWRFCVNYIPLNGVTRFVAYPIPHCDTAVFTKFSMGWGTHECLTRLWDIINLPLLVQVRKSLLFRGLMQSSGHIM